MRLASLLAALLVALVSLPALAAPPDPAMSFCTAEDVVDKYDTQALAQRTGDPTGVTIDAAVLADAVDDFSNRMAPYVRVAYPAVDFGATEPALNALATEGTYLELAKRRPLGMSESERAEYAALFRQLGEIASGRVALLLPVGSVDPAPVILPEDSFRSNPREFGRRRWTRPSAT